MTLAVFSRKNSNCCECMCDKLLQLCPTLCNSMFCWSARLLCPWDSQAKILEWVAMPFSKGSSPGIELKRSLTSLKLAGVFFITSATWETQIIAGWCSNFFYYKLGVKSLVRKKQKKVKSLSRVCLFVTQWTVAYQAPPSRGILQARILEWVGISFSRGSSGPRDRTLVSCIAGRRFTLWATREVQSLATRW